MGSQDQTTTTPGPSQPSSATPANPAPTFPITPPVLSSSGSLDDNYVVFNREDTLAILTNRTEGVTLDKTLNFSESTLFIYAEKVTLASSKIAIPGKNLGIFCNQLVIDKSCNGHACIDVSGEDGNVGVSKAVGKTAAAGSTNTAPVATTIEPPTPTVDAAAPAGIAATAAASSSASNGQTGGDAGAIWLYVEAPDPDLNTTLTLKAFGGDGGKGGNGSTAGNGGDGGTCGNLRCYIGSEPLRYGLYLTTTTDQYKKPWVLWIDDVNTNLSATLTTTLLADGVDGTVLTAWATMVSSMSQLHLSATNLQTQLADLVRIDNPLSVTPIPGPATMKSAKALLVALRKLRDSSGGPGNPDGSEATAMNHLAAQCKNFVGGVQNEENLQTALAAVTTMVTNLTVAYSAPSPLRDQLSTLMDCLQIAADTQKDSFIETVCQLAGGKGGAGGSGLTAAESSGARGTDQPDNHAEAFFVSLVGTRADCNIDQAFACPEQCQMILEAADALYFTNDRNKFPEAMKLYNKLTERLGFLDVMLRGDGAPIGCALTTALEWLSSYYNLTTEPISQLNRIYKTAERRLSSMILNQDIWGHSATWVPRLSLAYYQARVPTMIATFEALEKVFSKYAKADQKQQLAQDQVDTAQTSNTAMEDAANSQIQDITNTGGELDVALAAILVFTPQMQIAQQQLSTALETFTDDIQNKFDVTPDLVLNALSTLCMAPDELTTGVQGVNVAYQSWTTIANNKNNRVNKSYIVQQLGQCQGTISSLVNTFQILDPGDLTADQPDYAKIFATNDTITKLIKNFSAQIPTATSAAVTADLKNFINLVTQRNDAVVNYNALVQTVLQLENIVAGCAGESATLGTEALNFDPALPTIYFWLKRLMCQNQLQIMEELNCQARALAFWGPMDIDTVSFSTPGPMNGSINLLNYQSQLSSKFESCFDTFQSGGWSSWPESKNFLEQGIIVQLDSDTLSDIKDPTKNYTAMFPITPASSPSFSDMVNVRLTQVRVWLLGATVGLNTPNNTNNSNNTNNTSSPSQTAAPNTSQVTTSSSPAATTPNTTSTTGSTPTPLPATGQTSITNSSHPLRIEILQSGGEVIWSPDGKPHAFSHTPVSLQFSYETTIFNQKGKCSGDPKLVYDIQDIQYDYAGRPNLPGVNEKPPIGPFCDWTVQVREDANPGLDLSSVTAGYIEFCGRNMALNEGSTLDLHTEHLWGERIKAT
ncbi:uncharacterized protein NECHADRAFT_88815 [Fusarium vanettenii 77-13-4]|uniref:Uncharacterized protein n=1 Tax=Fusarium vanettenii (strain ATCC MYA-4622 / CBS 123669 / FGSC 9596 / NRRL 45880 / 77-13-4) TaxID=660122 RepID=C7ZQ10_FUSV7|nr:uncharacterized protein NECHADRAFT_88815 [Fusarium vanettenii 77-13-4]EEU33890.1 hypothetical protein NECHADRAFT_88815 [Fusarium vanettenii 77-13-4]